MAAAIAPKPYGSSTTGVKKSTVWTSAVCVVEAEDAGVVAGLVVDEHARVVGWRQAAQDLGELGGAELARSTGAGDPLGEPPDPLALVGHGRRLRRRLDI